MSALAVLSRASVELLQDSVNIESQLPRILASALAVELDRVALDGAGTGSEPQGITNFAALTANSFGGGTLSSYSPLVTARTALRQVNVDPTAYILNPRDEGALADLQDTTNQPLNIPPSIRDIPMFATTSLPTSGASPDESKIIAGDFSRLIVGMRQQLRIEVLREKFMDTLEIGFIAHLRADIAAEHEESFTVLSGITPA